jgi:segregation and condensation protein A
LDQFEGPLDLLLFLVRKNEVDIYDIPIARITEEFLEYVELIEVLDLDLAGDFLAVASTLIHIKSRMLLPEDPLEEEAEDPRMEIVLPLLEYARIKDAALKLEGRDLLYRDVFSRDFIAEELNEETEEELISVSLFDLLSAFKRVVESTSGKKTLELEQHEYSLEDKMTDVLERLRQVRSLLFVELFSSANRAELVVTFLALLELIRVGMIRAFQNTEDGAIRVFLVPEKGGKKLPDA